MAELVPNSRPEHPPDRRPEGLVARRDVRVSDAERQAVVDELRVHAGAGRIDLSELEERSATALAARVRGDLQPLLDDLPDLNPPTSPASAPSGPPVRERASSDRRLMASPGFRLHLYVWLVLTAFFVVIWVTAGAGGTFWPVFPSASIGLTVGLHGAARKAVDVPDIPGSGRPRSPGR